jgi:hypothetical protein
MMPNGRRPSPEDRERAEQLLNATVRNPEWQPGTRRPGIRGDVDNVHVIDEVERALRDLGATDRESAELALLDWPHAAELTDRERTAVLSRFDA